MFEIKLDKSLQRQLNKAVKKLPASVFNRCVKSATIKAAAAIRKEARNLAPKKTGALRKSIGTVAIVDKKALKIQSIVKPRAKKGDTDKASPTKYAHLVEFGTQAHWIKPKTGKALKTPLGIFAVVDVEGIKPHPFLRPAYDNKKEEAVKIFIQVVLDKIKTAIEKAKK